MDVESISDFKLCSYETLSPRFVSRLTGKACTVEVGSFDGSVTYAGDLFLCWARRNAEGVVHIAVRTGCGPRAAAQSELELGYRAGGSPAAPPPNEKSFARGVCCTFLIARGRLGPGSCLLAFPLITLQGGNRIQPGGIKDLWDEEVQWSRVKVDRFTAVSKSLPHLSVLHVKIYNS